MPINELDGCCVLLPENACPFSSSDAPRCFAAVLIENVGHRLIGRHVPFDNQATVIRRICAECAVETVDGSRVLQGQRVTPEQYLGWWRARLAQPVRLDDLAHIKQLRAVAVFQWQHSEVVASRRPSWNDAPYDSFGSLLCAHGFAPAQQEPSCLPEFSRLEIDLACQNGARDAWWADDFMSTFSQADVVLRREIELRPVPGPPAPPAPPAPAGQRSYNLRAAQALANF